ncbi:hypothetical protein Ddc_12552 [Ditylenchus destructor]|nr:hypothetical protein Ddc_12552 [Ditylenchus destructor]
MRTGSPMLSRASPYKAEKETLRTANNKKWGKDGGKASGVTNHFCSFFSWNALEGGVRSRRFFIIHENGTMFALW